MRGLLLLLSLTSWAMAQDLEMRQSGRVQARFSLAELKKIATPTTLRLDAGTRNYWVVPVKPLLEKVYGARAYGEDITFLFVCRDGYRSPVKAEELRVLPAYLAFASSDGKPFELEKKPLGPFYLVWDSEKYPERKLGGNWPYQVVAIDRANFSQAYAATLPPPKSSAQVQHGFAVFRKKCLSCHQINGQGGSMGIDLNQPVSVTEYIKKPYLHKIISDPSKVRGRATMPALDPKFPQREQAIKDIIAYLEAKAAQRRKSSKAAKPGK
ncbi:MAG: c-type cytochrome [Candidatus Eremiobacteraeota bacterium]|nr:c-type cytochrome [Candidatus Eremiobacteraeota bacterium]